MESFCVLNFIAYCAYTLNRKTGEGLFEGGSVTNTSNTVEIVDEQSQTATTEKETDYYELFVIICFLLIILLQVCQIISSVYQALKDFIISQKLKKKEVAKQNLKQKEDKYYSNPLLCWKPSVEYQEMKKAEENKFFSNFDSNVNPKQIKNLMKNHKKSKKKYSLNRQLMSKQKGLTSTHEILRNNMKGMKNPSNFNVQRGNSSETQNIITKKNIKASNFATSNNLD